MRRSGRVTALTMVATLGAVVQATASVVTAPATSAAPHAFVVSGTNEPNANVIADYNKNVLDYYLTPFTGCTDKDGCGVRGIIYPAQFWPVPGWGLISAPSWNQSVATGVDGLNNALVLWNQTDTSDDPIVLFGYSQGARVVSMSKEYFASNIPDQGLKDRLQFGFIGNISRPNGGAFARLSFFGYVPIWDVTYGHATPTDLGADCTDGVTPCSTTDIALQYDGVADFPNYVLNATAMLNSAIALFTVHPTYLAPNGNTPAYQLPDGYLAGQGYTPEQLNNLLNDPAYQRRYGDTLYITLPTPILPIVQPLLLLGQSVPLLSPAINPIVEFVSPILRWEIDNGYDRTVNPGEPTGIKLIRIPFVDYDPFQEIGELAGAVQQGISDVFDGVAPAWAAPPPTMASSTPTAFAGPGAATAVVEQAGTRPDPTAPEPVAEQDRTASHGLDGLEAQTSSAGKAPDSAELATIDAAKPDVTTGNKVAPSLADSSAASSRVEHAVAPERSTATGSDSVDADQADAAAADTRPGEVTSSGGDSSSAP